MAGQAALPIHKINFLILRKLTENENNADKLILYGCMHPKKTLHLEDQNGNDDFKI